jgi:hypothetical protein
MQLRHQFAPPRVTVRISEDDQTKTEPWSKPEHDDD